MGMGGGGVGMGGGGVGGMGERAGWKNPGRPPTNPHAGMLAGWCALRYGAYLPPVAGLQLAEDVQLWVRGAQAVQAGHVPAICVRVGGGGSMCMSVCACAWACVLACSGGQRQVGQVPPPPPPLLCPPPLRSCSPAPKSRCRCRPGGPLPPPGKRCSPLACVRACVAACVRACTTAPRAAHAAHPPASAHCGAPTTATKQAS